MQYWFEWPRRLQLLQVGTFEDFTFDIRAVRVISDIVDDFSVAA